MRLCVNADDFGYSEEINRGIREAIEHGVVTSSSVITVRGLHRQIRDLARDFGISVGLHFTLTLHRDFGKGQFGSVASLISALVLRRVSFRAIEKELERQYAELCEVMGGSPSHIDCHHHVHMLPGVRRMVFEFARDRGVGHVRVPRERVQGLAPKARLLAAASAGVRSPVAFMGQSLAGKDFDGEAACFAVRELVTRRIACVEWMVHVGRYSPSLENRDPYNGQREHELVTLMGMREFLRNHTTLVPMNGLR